MTDLSKMELLLLVQLCIIVPVVASHEDKDEYTVVKCTNGSTCYQDIPLNKSVTPASSPQEKHTNFPVSSGVHAQTNKPLHNVYEDINENAHIPSRVFNSAADTSQTCPTWFLPEQSEGKRNCTCASELHGRISCNQNTTEVSILYCYCMSYDSNTNKTSFGACIYNCFKQHDYTAQESVYQKLPHSPARLNNRVCKPLNRAGQLCGNCADGYTHPPYYYSLRCVKCSYSRWNWVWYILVAYIPLTVFFLFMNSCRLSAASNKFSILVCITQALSIPTNARVVLAAIEAGSSLTVPLYIGRVLLTLYGIWNLDFFRTIIPPICLNVSSLQSLSLDYAIGFYPLVLIIATRTVIWLYWRGFGPVMCIWRCLQPLFARLHPWDHGSSIIQAFALFLCLSYVKVLSVSFDILVPTRVFNVNGSSNLYLYYNASIEYFGHEHLPYALIALTILFLFNILPLVLLLFYPLQCVQRCLDHYKLQSHALNMFMDAFQGHFKDGTSGTRDCRCFAAVPFIVQVLGYITYACTLSSYTYAVLSLMLIAVSALMAYFQPYKNPSHSGTSTVLLLSLAGFFMCVLSTDVGGYTRNVTFVAFSMTVGGFLALVPLFWFAAHVLNWLVFQKRLPHRCMQWFRSERISDAESSSLLVHDRLGRPYSYGAALPEIAEDSNREVIVEEDSNKECQI